MSAWVWLLVICGISFPTSVMFYKAYRLRRWRDLSRFHLLRGVTFLAICGALAASSLFPSIFARVMPWVLGVLFFAGPFVATPLLRKTAERIAKDPEEAKRYEEATSLFKQ
jgi:hypothetical protein